MSTFIERKSTGIAVSDLGELKLRSASRGSLPPPPPLPPQQSAEEAVTARPKKTISMAKLQELERAKF